MRETGAPDGFAYAEEIPFTVSEDGTVERISMQDTPKQKGAKKPVTQNTV